VVGFYRFAAGKNPISLLVSYGVKIEFLFERIQEFIPCVSPPVGRWKAF